MSGELSGDSHGKDLLESLKRKHSQLQLFGVGGPHMRPHLESSIFSMENLQVMGFIDVVKSLPKLYRLLQRAKNAILKESPQGIVFIDYPGFHLKLAKMLRKGGYKGKLIHYISPSVWAWKKGRISLMEKYLDLLLTILPFEKRCFEHTSLPVKYVGHPLARPFNHSRKKRKHLLAIFPGSREKEVKRNLKEQLKAACALQKQDPSLEIAVSVAHSNLLPVISPLLEKNIQLFDPEKQWDLMETCCVAIATSGTVTLELALRKTPTVVTYRLTALDQWLAQKIFRIRLPFYALPNLIANMEVFPEFFGKHFTAQSLQKALFLFLKQKTLRQQCEKECQKIIDQLGDGSAPQAAAHHILNQFI